MSVENALASLAVRDLEVSVEWYAKLLGRGPDFRPMAEVAEWKFAGGGGLQVYELAERAGDCSCTLVTNDIVDIVRVADSLGVDTSRKSSGPKVKTLMITDPDGNHLAFAQSADGSMLR